ncbi:C2 and GRAM domain-containing protein At1g03370 isoform X1 [Nymphaea colorata]|nr:C2 and GRAM domain-containing protein At1g03370 isoform X1 [Nymphaea colorata]
MKLAVRVIEARDLPAKDFNGFSDPYAKLQLGRHRCRTKVVKRNLNPSWKEEFSFKVDDLNEELCISVLDEDKYFNDDFVGQLKIPVAKVFDAEGHVLAPEWYPLQPRNKKSKNTDCGEIFLALSLSQNDSPHDQFPNVPNGEGTAHSEKSFDSSLVSDGSVTSAASCKEEVSFSEEEKPSTQSLAGRLVHILLNRNSEPPATNIEKLAVPELRESLPVQDTMSESSNDLSSVGTFEEALKSLQSRDQGQDMPPNLTSGVLLDQNYVISPWHLNFLLFAPDSTFMKSLVEMQGTTDLVEGPWKLEETLKRVVTYTKAPTRLIKAVKATEEQTYLKADGKSFAILESVSTPDVPYGSCFRVELLFCVNPGPEIPSGEQTAHLVISWRMNFLQSTMMKGMIENGAKQGLKDNFDQFSHLLADTVKPLDLTEAGSEKERVLSSLQTEQESDWKLAWRFLGNCTMLSGLVIGFLFFLHIMLSKPNSKQGLEFDGLDMPDSIGEVLVAGILVLQGQRVLEMISRYMQARRQKSSDHGVKAQGDGWLLTVALIEGTKLAPVDATGFSDPYVVFTCSGKSKTSSIKFQTLNPRWNEVFEFDAMDDPPSVMDVEVYDFDGPFDEATSLGHVEINFLKSNLDDLADIWIPLKGKLAQTYQSKLHLRVFLSNTKGTEVAREYISKMEKEVGKKINVRSLQTNTAFQKLFGLPPEEFLINDFTCHLKRKMPLQGRLFLSARIIGFHANLFGHKTKFFFLWEDIEDIQVIPPSLASVGSPSLLIILRKGRGMDARHGAKALDEEGRLRFHFQSFVSFQAANKTIMALCRARSLTLEQKMQIVEEDSDTKSIQNEENESLLGNEDVIMKEVYSSLQSIHIDALMELFDGGDLERKVMEKVGCINYVCTAWELKQRQLSYKFDKRISRFGGEVNSTQQKSFLPGQKGWSIEEVMTLQGVPLGDNFNLHLRYQVENVPSRSKACNVQVYLGIQWLKSTKQQKRISKNIEAKLTEHLKEIFVIAQKEFLLAKPLEPLHKGQSI